jgi:hypothetical protein
MKKIKLSANVGDARIAYTPILGDDGEYRLGIAEEGKPGYYKVKDDSDLGGTYRDRKDAQATADVMNERLGLSKQEALKIVSSSLWAGK